MLRRKAGTVDILPLKAIRPGPTGLFFDQRRAYCFHFPADRIALLLSSKNRIVVPREAREAQGGAPWRQIARCSAREYRCHSSETPILVEGAARIGQTALSGGPSRSGARRLGLTLVRALLRRHRRIAIDTSVFICYLEGNPLYVDMAGEVFTWLERSPHSAVTSSLTMTELLVQQYRARNETLIDQYYGLLSTYPNLEWVAPDLVIADTAAKIRAERRLRTPDALQAATAVCRGATALLTNDPDFGRVAEVEVGVLDRLR